MEEIINFTSIAGMFALAISGALTAMEKRFDPFGIFIIGFVTGAGGGTIRDMMLSGRNVFWLVEPAYTYVAIAGTLFAILFRKYLGYLRTTLSLFDTIGLALYTVIGVQIGIMHDLPGLSCVVLGTLTGAFGGVVRDILVNDVPLIFKKEVYATISILGGSLYYVFHIFELNTTMAEIIAIALIIVLRLLVVKYKVSLPSVYK